jgi:signal peptidase II
VVLFAGAIGNMIDRVARGYVVDMFDFCLINFPVFNVADIYVTCSFIIIALLVLFKYKDDELEAVFRKNN